jgi:hypothetical protein
MKTLGTIRQGGKSLFEDLSFELSLVRERDVPKLSTTSSLACGFPKVWLTML